MNPIIVIGADSYIGSAVVKKFRADGQTVIACGRREKSEFRVDLTDPSSWPLLDDYQNCPVVFCAAMSRVVDCEENPDVADGINNRSTCELIARLQARACYPVFLSTNLVFPTDAPDYGIDDPTAPQGVYGQTKVGVEDFLEQSGKPYSVLRLTKVLGDALPLLDGFVEKGLVGETIKPFADLAIAPVALSDVVRCIEHLIENRCHGVYQLSGEKNSNYVEMAGYIFEALNIDVKLVESGSIESIGGVPLIYSSMKNHWPEGFSADVSLSGALGAFLQRRKMLLNNKASPSKT